MRPILLILAIAVLIFYVYEDSAHSTYPPGVIAPSEPSQTLLGAGTTWQQGKFRFTARADFSMRVRVLSTERYYFDPGAKVSPIDFALGWGAVLSGAAVGVRVLNKQKERVEAQQAEPVEEQTK